MITRMARCESFDHTTGDLLFEVIEELVPPGKHGLDELVQLGNPSHFGPPHPCSQKPLGARGRRLATGVASIRVAGRQHD